MRYTREDGCLAWLTYGEFQPETMAAMLRQHGCAEAIYDRFRRMGSAALKPFANQSQVELLAAQAGPDAMHEMMLTLQKWEIGLLRRDDADYPDALQHIPDPPYLLFYRGNPACLVGRCVAMIGSRKASVAGLRAARDIARELSRNGVRVISGMAMGIDTASLEGALEGGSPAVGVLGCGLDVDYPAENQQLKERIIAAGGLLLSEYPPGVKGMPWHFPVRNRIMSGLSSAVLMMEGRIRSGSMTTVQHALDQGREVFAYPGAPGTEWAEGAHQLLREGANYFTSAADVLEDLGWRAEKPARASAPARAELPPLTEEQKKVYGLLTRGELSFDELAAASGLSSPSLSVTLTMLQVMGLIEALPGKVYKTA